MTSDTKKGLSSVRAALLGVTVIWSLASCLHAAAPAPLPFDGSTQALEHSGLSLRGRGQLTRLFLFQQ